jgi:hypothetical protein
VVLEKLRRTSSMESSTTAIATFYVAIACTLIEKIVVGLPRLAIYVGEMRKKRGSKH